MGQTFVHHFPAPEFAPSAASSFFDDGGVAFLGELSLEPSPGDLSTQ